MNDPRDLHRQAMTLADEAFVARRNGDEESAISLFRRAFELEHRAATSFEAALETEPTRSVLYRSAASLALDCNDYRAAERQIAMALAGDPPDRIANELRDLLEMVHFQRHLDLRGVRLQVDEFQFTIEGSGIGFGIAPAGQFVTRVRDVETLIYRTAERKLKQPFREAGRRKKALDESLQLYVSVPRAASFAVTFRLGASEQLEIAETSLTSEVVNEVLDCVDLVNHGQLAELEARIDDEAYYRNFLGLTQKIAPDGNIVKSVGFTAARRDDERRVSLTVPRERIGRPEKTVPSVPVSPVGTTLVELTGSLLEADAKADKHGIIQVRTSEGVVHRITVPRGMMRDIVRPLFEEDVIVTGRQTGSTILLDSIRAAED